MLYPAELRGRKRGILPELDRVVTCVWLAVSVDAGQNLAVRLAAAIEKSFDDPI